MPTLINFNSLVPEKQRLTFLGDSITNSGLFIAYMDAYFRQHMPERNITLINLGVNSETVSGLSEPDHPFPRPCLQDRLSTALEQSKPDWVVIGYGMNDGIYSPYSEDHFKAYQEGIRKVVYEVKRRGVKAIVMTPPPFDAASFEGELILSGSYSWKTPYRSYNEVLKRYADWLLSLGNEVDGIVDIYQPLLQSVEAERRKDPSYLSGDGIHPNAKGHWVMAKILLGELFNITLAREPAYVEKPEEDAFFTIVQNRHSILSAAWKEHVGHTNPNKDEALPLHEAILRSAEMDEQIGHLLKEQSDAIMEQPFENGAVRKDFYLNGREAVLICPQTPAPGRPWVWRAEFLGAFDYADRALLEEGWHLAYYRLSHMFGCPYAISLMHHFQQHLEISYNLSPRAVMFGFSRGGLYAMNYAAAYPNNVRLLYLDAPVLDIRSWPGGKGQGQGSPKDWEKCLAIYGINDETAKGFYGNPLDHIDKIASALLPIMVVVGDRDRVVPFEENTAILEARIRSLKGNIQVLVKPGIDHHPHSLEDPEPIIEFIKKH
ncbi:prolyl oligopeptidase family serine peptidase [Paenibacillus sp. SYP-B3998]|uniref:Prolyl oligopeptidase family serine peptidase n=1 Tax=Paenibacillus sp. SYP-B3998 TaxID=2678564 RepID=A0A6G4A3N8_9BACL|nr:GDSL-type esterase/lipase family protein [Paenibacillus sp. SYP-B3998]NEW08267.1 prolyl oligopeptidase family serine peptidase [Paenibacillus sp. SYP-B3998]